MHVNQWQHNEPRHMGSSLAPRSPRLPVDPPPPLPPERGGSGFWTRRRTIVIRGRHQGVDLPRSWACCVLGVGGWRAAMRWAAFARLLRGEDTSNLSPGWPPSGLYE